MGNIEIELLDEPNVETEVLDLNYIPDYQVYEQQRQANEVIRQDNEATRKSNETTRQNNETGRTTAEGLRVNAESGRVDAESLRVTAEQGRVDAEALRVQAENGRVLAEEAREAVINSLATVATTGSYSDLIDEPTKVSDFTNDLGFIDKNVNNLTYYTLATGTGSSIELGINQSTYVVTLNLKNSAGTTISTGSIDLPLESVVVGGYYDAATKKVILTLQNGNTISFSVADLVSGLQTEIDADHKVSADYIDDTSTTNKFVTSTNKTTWNAKYDKPSGGIPKTDLSSSVQASLDLADSAIQDVSGKEDVANKVTSISDSSTDTQYPSAKCVYDSQTAQDENIEELEQDYNELKLIENALPTSTQTKQTSSSVNNTANMRLKNIELFGNTSQETTIGKNLVNVVSTNQIVYSNSYNNFTLNNGVVTTTGNTLVGFKVKVEPSTEYTLHANKTGSEGTNALRSREYSQEPTDWDTNFVVQNASSYASGSATITFTTDSTTQWILVVIYSSGSGNVISNIQLELGGTATDYEKFTYGASPNPLYPQPIHVVTGDNTIQVCRKNLLEPNTFAQKVIDTPYNSSNTSTYNSETGELSIKMGNGSEIFNNFKENTQYTIILKYNTTTSSTNLRIRYTDNTATNLNVGAGGGSGTIAFISSNSKSVRSIEHYSGDSSGTRTLYLKESGIFEGVLTTDDYEPYSGGTYPINLGVKNIFNPSLLSQQESYNTYNSSTGLWTTSDSSGYSRSILYGVNGATSDRNITKLIKVDTNKEYTLKFYDLVNNTSSTNYLSYAFFDDNGEIIGDSTNVSTNPFTFTTPNQNCYLDIRRYYNSGTLSFSKIQLEEGSKANSYTPYGTTPIEMCNINDYEDILFKADDKDQFYNTLDSATKSTLDYGSWYKYGAVGKVVLDGSESQGSSVGWKKSTTTDVDRFIYAFTLSERIYETSNKSLCNNYAWSNTNPISSFRYNGSQLIFNHSTYSSTTTIDDYLTWVSSHNLIIYMPLITPTYTKITNTTLINQLNDIEKALSYQHQTNLTQTNNDLPFEITTEMFLNMNDILSTLNARVTLLEE